MYLPRHYAVTDVDALHEFIRSHGFGILFSWTGEEPMASHLPFILDEDSGEQGTLLGHMARANDQWRYADGQRVLVVFHGPHAYVSPTWYREPDTVPTWNYVTAHVYGTFRAKPSAEDTQQIVGRVTDYYESFQPSPWKPDFSTEFTQQMVKRIVAFKIEIEKVQGKWKLNQNHPDRRRERVAETLRTLSGDNPQEIAELIEAELGRGPS